MNHTIQLCHDKQTHTVTLTMCYDNEPDARVAYPQLVSSALRSAPRLRRGRGSAVHNPPQRYSCRCAVRSSSC
ncbi:hypothetical protein [Hymenobacter sp.]|uniref:hypothetical protein n=1 Tax=Hymenobacter sp. TaxID=1898978 RepID=UPI002EDA6B2A